MGRSLLGKHETTVADIFSSGGYRTAIFGKWHLGDNYPFRPQDRGFQEVLIHGGGGVGQGPDYWGNDYFDDTYFHNGKEKKFEGYCTDIWFDGALKFIEANKSRPFFCYIPTNAPHGPYNVADKYSKPYRDKGVNANQANFYGMITNIDEHLEATRGVCAARRVRNTRAGTACRSLSVGLPVVLMSRATSTGSRRILMFCRP
jgi:hypothetical protein